MLQEFAQKIEQTSKEILNEIHTVLPGKFQSFDPTKGTATVKPIGKYVLQNGEKLEYPEITEVPVLFPYHQAAGIGMLFPIQKEDRCLILVSEMELDEWRSGAESEAPLRFDLSSAVVLPGLLLEGKEVSGIYRPDAVVVRAGKVDWILSENGIVCHGDIQVNGTLSCTGDVKAGGIHLKKHTHVSAPPGSATSQPQ